MTSSVWKAWLVACALAAGVLASPRAWCAPRHAKPAPKNPAPAATPPTPPIEVGDPSPVGITPEARPPASFAGPEAGFRTGLAFPGGEVVSGAPAAGLGKSMIPLWIDFGYRFNKYLFVGPFVQAGFVLQSDQSCPSDASCHALDFRFGASAQVHVLPTGRIDPWFGVGAGYEAYHKSISGAPAAWARGFELLNATFGVLYKDSDQGGVGPFVAVTMATYSKIAGIAIDNTASHRWLMVGIHGSYWTGL